MLFALQVSFNMMLKSICMFLLFAGILFSYRGNSFADFVGVRGGGGLNHFF